MTIEYKLDEYELATKITEKGKYHIMSDAITSDNLPNGYVAFIECKVGEYEVIEEWIKQGIHESEGKITIPYDRLCKRCYG